MSPIYLRERAARGGGGYGGGGILNYNGCGRGEDFSWTSSMDDPLVKFGWDMGWVSLQLDMTLNTFT